MAVSYRSSAGTDFGAPTTTQSPVVSAPAGIQDGDLLLLFLQTQGNHDSQSVTGWTRVAEVDNTDSSASLYWRIASGESSSWTLTNLFAAGEDGRAVVVAYSGADSTGPINQSGQTSTSGVTSISGPSVTPTVDGCMIVQLVGCDPGTTAYSGTADTDPAATERYDEKDATNSNAYIFVQDYLQATAAAVSLDAAFNATDVWNHFVVAIAPGAITLAVADAYVTTQTDALTLTAPGAVTVADGYTTSQADAVSLTQVHNLTVNDSSVTTQIDAVSLSGSAATTLTVADAFTTTQADSVSTKKRYTDGYGGQVATYQDNILNSAAATLNLGAHANNELSPTQNALFRFDVSAIPSGSVCSAANLHLYKSYPQGEGGGTITVTVYSVSQANGDWVEGGGNLELAAAGESCWNAKAADGSGGVTTAWAGSAGCETAGVDYESTLLGTLTWTPLDDAIGTEYVIPLSTERIEGWFGDNNTNYGLILFTSGGGDHVGTAENTNTAYRPKFVVDYTDANILTVDDGSITPAVDPVSLSAAASVSVEDGYTTSQIDAVTISQVHNLTVADSYTTTQTDAVTLAINTSLAVAGGYTTTQADEITLDGSASLTVADGYSTTQGDAVSLTQAHNLIVADASVAPQCDSIALTQAQLLTVAGGYVTTQADNLTLLAATLVVAACYVSVQVDTVTLEQRRSPGGPRQPHEPKPPKTLSEAVGIRGRSRTMIRRY